MALFVLVAGKWGYYAAWLYLSTCMAVFLVRTLKRAVFQEVRNYGEGAGVKRRQLDGLVMVVLLVVVLGFPLACRRTFCGLAERQSVAFRRMLQSGCDVRAGSTPGCP